jgi:hypothetical protein
VAGPREVRRVEALPGAEEAYDPMVADGEMRTRPRPDLSVCAETRPGASSGRTDAAWTQTTCGHCK